MKIEEDIRVSLFLNLIIFDCGFPIEVFSKCLEFNKLEKRQYLPHY